MSLVLWVTVQKLLFQMPPCGEWKQFNQIAKGEIRLPPFYNFFWLALAATDHTTN